MNTVARTLAICLVGMMGLGPPPPATAQEPSPDRMRIDKLVKAGSDVSKSHHIDFYLRFPTQQAAEKAETKLISLAFATSVERTKAGSEWLVVASKVMLPVEPDLSGLRDKLNYIAAADHGVYEGWETKVVK